MQRALIGGVTRTVGGGLDVGCDAGSFPVAARLRADGRGNRDGRLQVRMDPEALARVGAAAAGFANNDGPAELLEVIAELLPTGERDGTRQHVHRLVLAESAARNVRQRPGLPEQVVLAFPQPRKLGWVAVPQV